MWTAKSTLVTSVLFAATIFLGSFLLFVSEPVQGKMLLPWLGGTPAVWNGCLMFFQAVLLFGYLYAHLVSTKLTMRLQIVVHGLMLLVPLAFLPVQIPTGLAQDPLLQEQPLLWLMTALAVTIGPAFFTVAATSPLMQSWFVRANPHGKNPYALYAAGNAGSLLALLCYPFVIEPELALGRQTQVWTAAYVGLIVLSVGTGIIAWRRSSRLSAAAPDGTTSDRAEAVGEGDANGAQSAGWGPADIDHWTGQNGSTSRFSQRLRWILQAAVPSSLMLAVTTYLTTDIAAIPLLWILPLALYTLSFVLVFARYAPSTDRWLSRIALPAVALLLFLIFTEFRDNLWLVITLHLSAFFLLAVAAHGRLALSRPAPKDLTAYYFYMALGGVLGGTFNTLIAPLLFTGVTEYPLAALAAVWIARPRAKPESGSARANAGYLQMFAGASALAALTYGLFEMHEQGLFTALGTAAADWIPEGEMPGVLIYGIPALILMAMAKGSRRAWINVTTGAAIGFVAVTMVRDLYTATLFQSRSFFGVLTVRAYEDGKTHSLVHGGILHGEQWRTPPEARSEPRSYYHKDGPLGQIMGAVNDLVQNPRIAAIGLGAGTVAAYGTKDNSITFYELDPNVERLARSPKLFTYVDDCIKRWCNLRIVIGDGRLQIAKAPEAYDLVIVDAFSSDAIPIHLLTVEALQTYLSKMTGSGIVAFHISNRYVDLEPVLLNLAQELNLGYAIRSDEDDDETGRGASTWVILAAQEGLFEKIAVDDERWRGLEPRDGVGLWRDDFANVASAFLWN